MKNNYNIYFTKVFCLISWIIIIIKELHSINI